MRVCERLFLDEDLVPNETDGAEGNKITSTPRIAWDINCLVFFILNLIWIAPTLLSHMSDSLVWEIVASVVLLIASFFFTVVKAKKNQAAYCNVPTLMFFNALALMSLESQTLIDSFNEETLAQTLESIGQTGVIPFAVGLVLALFASKSVGRLWLQAIGKTMVGGALVIAFVGSPMDPINGLTIPFYLFYLVFSVLWFVMCAAVCYADRTCYLRVKRISSAMLLLFYLLAFVSPGTIWRFASTLKDWFLSMPMETFSWGKVLLAVVLLAVGAFLANSDKSIYSIGKDSAVLLILAEAILLIKLLMTYYFIVSWVVFVLFILSSLMCIKNECNGKLSFGKISTPLYLCVQTVFFLATVFLVKEWLWICYIVLVLYLLFIYRADASDQDSAGFWIGLMAGPTLFAAGYIWERCMHTETMVLLGIVFVVHAVAAAFIYVRRPDGKTGPKRFKLLLVASLVIGCIMIAASFGAKVDVAFESDRSVVHIVAESDDFEIDSAVFFWRDSRGNELGKSNVLPTGGTATAIKGEMLTVVITDARGIVTRKTVWYPHWLLTNWR